MEFIEKFINLLQSALTIDLSAFEVLLMFAFAGALIFLIWAILSSNFNSGSILSELGLAKEGKRLKIKKESNFLCIYPVKVKFLNKKFWRDNFEIFENIFSRKFIEVKIDRNRVELIYDNLPKNVPLLDIPDLKPMETWLGKNQFNNDVIIDLQSTPGIYIDGKPKSGKSVAIVAILEGFLVGVGSKVDLLLVTTKTHDFYHLNSDSRIRLTLINPFDGNFVEQIEKILVFFDKISLIEKDFKKTIIERELSGASTLNDLINQGICEPSRMFFIFDEAKDYLSKEKTDDKTTAESRAKLIRAVYTHIRRTARYLSMPIIVASQTQAESDLDIPLKAFHLRLASSTNEAMSKLVCGDRRLADKSFSKGKYFIKTDLDEHIVRIPFKQNL